MKKTLSVLFLGILIGVGAFVSFTKADTIENFLTDISAKTLGLRIEGDVAFEKNLYVGDKVGIGTANPTEKLTVDGVVEAKGGVKFGDGSSMNSANFTNFTKQTIVGDGETIIDWNLGNNVDFTFGALNESFAFINPTIPGYFTLKLKQDSIGSRLASFNTSINWANNSTPIFSTNATNVDLVNFYFDGESYYENSISYNLGSRPINQTYLYNEGTENIAWVAGYKRNYNYVEKASEWFYARLPRINASDYTYVTDNPVDLTNIDELIVDWDGNGYDPYGILLSVSTNKTGRTRLDANQFRRNDEFTRTENSLDVSELLGSYYVKVAIEGAEITPSNSEFRVYNVYARKNP